MGKHKDPEVADHKGDANETGQGEGGSENASDKAVGGAGGGSRGGRGRKGARGTGGTGGSGRAAAKSTDETRSEARSDESAGAPDSPAKDQEKARRKAEEAATDRPGDTPAETGDERAGQPEAGEERERHEELAYHDEAMSELADQVVEERSHRTLYATMFYVLLGIVVVAGLTLWGAPKIAPHVPGFIAQYLVPGQVETAERVTALEARLAEQAETTGPEVAALRDRLDSLESEIEGGTASAETEAEIAEAAEAAASDVSALADRVDSLESRLAGVREEVNAVSETLTGAGEGAAPAELAAAVNSLRSRVDQLAGVVEGGPSTAELADRLESLGARVEELQGNVVAAQETESEVSSAIREARLQSAFDTLAGRIAAGQPYGAALSEITSLAETETPEALAASAETGLATTTELEASFGRHAQAAISANIRAANGDSAVGAALGWLRAQVAGRPVSEQEGDSVPAITSRIAARLEEGRLDAALAEAESLPEPAREALGGWLERLRARVEAEQALAAWRDQTAAKG